MVIKQLWSKCRLCIVFPEDKNPAFLGWKALTILIIILSLVIPFDVSLKQILRKNIALVLIILSKILNR